MKRALYLLVMAVTAIGVEAADSAFSPDTGWGAPARTGPVEINDR